jgi:hypothetical protein
VGRRGANQRWCSMFCRVVRIPAFGCGTALRHLADLGGTRRRRLDFQENLEFYNFLTLVLLDIFRNKNILVSKEITRHSINCTGPTYLYKILQFRENAPGIHFDTKQRHLLRHYESDAQKT